MCVHEFLMGHTRSSNYSSNIYTYSCRSGRIWKNRSNAVAGLYVYSRIPVQRTCETFISAAAYTCIRAFFGGTRRRLGSCKRVCAYFYISGRDLRQILHSPAAYVVCICHVQLSFVPVNQICCPSIVSFIRKRRSCLSSASVICICHSYLSCPRVMRTCLLCHRGASKRRMSWTLLKI